MIPLGLCSVLALAVAIERAFRWLKLGGVSEADRVLALAGRGDWDEAARAGEESSSPVARVLAAGLRRRNPAPRLERDVETPSGRVFVRDVTIFETDTTTAKYSE